MIRVLGVLVQGTSNVPLWQVKLATGGSVDESSYCNVIIGKAKYAELISGMVLKHFPKYGEKTSPD